MNQLPKITVRNGLVSTMVFLLGTLYCLFSFQNMPQSEDPVLDLPSIGVLVIYPGASNADIEKHIVDPLEIAMRELSDVREINTSIQDEASFTEIEFDYGIDPDEKKSEVENQLNSILPELPDGIYHTEVIKYSTTTVRVVQLALASENMDYKELRATAEKLEKQIQKIPQVSKTEILACPEEEIRIALNPERMRQFGISTDMIGSAIQSYNAQIPGGKLKFGNQKLKLNTSGSYSGLGELNNTVISIVEGHPVYLREVAQTGFAYQEQNWIGRYNGKKAIYLTAQMKKSEDIFALKNNLTDIIDAFRFPTELECHYVFDQSVGVSERIDGFMSNLLEGILLVGLLCLLILGWRSSVLVMISVPLSILGGLAIVKAMGYGLNQISIAGLVIALGLLVDDAIGVVENSNRLLLTGKKFSRSVIKGAKQMVGPSLSGSITTIFAFLPILMIPDITGAFIRPMPVAVIATLTVSFLISITLIPLMYELFRSKKHQAALTKETRAFRYLQKFINGPYERILAKTLKKPFLYLAYVLLFLVIAFSLFSRLDVSFFPKAEKPLFRIQLESAYGSTLETTDAQVRKVEQLLMEDEELDFVASNIGHGNPRIYYNMFTKDYSPRYADIIVGLKSYHPKAFRQYLDTLRGKLSNIKGTEISIKEFIQGPNSDAPVYIEIKGNDLDKLKLYNSKVFDVLRNNKGIINISNPMAHTAIELKSKINKDKALALGIPLHTIDSGINALLSGRKIDEYTDREGNTYPIVIKHEDADSLTVSELGTVAFASVQSGDMYTLSSFSELEMTEGQSSIFHKDSDRISFIEADIEEGRSLDAVLESLKEELDKINWEKGYSYMFRGELESRDESFGSLGFASLFALLLIFFVLVIQFRSLTQPFIIFSALPFAFAGSFLLLYLTGIPISFTGFVGFTSLIGIAVNNTIVLVEFANRQRKKGHNKGHAIIKAAKVRFTPILLTTLTTILGLLPLTLLGGNLWKPMGWVIIGGLLASVTLILLILPVIYVLFTPEKL